MHSFSIIFVDQSEALGTGHAVQCVQPYLLNHNKTDKIVQPFAIRIYLQRVRTADQVVC